MTLPFVFFFPLSEEDEDEGLPLPVLLGAEVVLTIGGGGDGFFLTGDDLGEGDGGRFFTGDGGGLLSGFFFGDALFCDRTGFCRFGRALSFLAGTIGATFGGGAIADDSFDSSSSLALLLLLEDKLLSLRLRPGSS